MKSHLYPTRLLGALTIAQAVTAGIILDAGKSDSLLVKRDDPWPYGVIGDSWGSGVSYNDDVLFDGNKDNCLRTKESHGPQMLNDKSWTPDPSGLRDAACSGSRLVDLAKGNYQMGKVGDAPNVVVMTSGGNDCGFGVIVDVCIYHSSPTTDYGPAYKDDKDRTGRCAVELDKASNTIDNVLPGYLTDTLNDILADDHVKNNKDFLLYLTGYAQFFGTDYDDWCNSEYWNIPGRSSTPYLSKELRQAFNDRISKVNDLYKKTAEDPKYKDKVRFIDIDAGFSGHRFCEPGANHGDQLNTDTNFDKVYLWNLNWPWQVANTAAPSPEAQDGKVSIEEAEKIFGDDGGVTAWTGGSGSGGGGNEPGNGWRLRPFHPRTSGYTSIKNAILAQLKTDGLPKATSSGGGSDPPPSGGDYAKGTCSFHLDEWESCGSVGKNLFARIKMYDDKKNVIGETNLQPGSLGDPIDDGNSLSFKSKLPNPLVVTGEHQDDYVQFTIGDLSWQSKKPNGGASCTVGGWDPRDGPTCGLRFGNQNAHNQMDCSFPC